MKKQNLLVEWDACGLPNCIKDPSDPLKMNWISPYYKTGEVRGFSFQSCKKTKNGVEVLAQSTEGIQLKIRRKLLAEKYVETYIFSNPTPNTVTLGQDFGAVSYAGNCYFDKQPDMLFTRCNTHIFTGEDITYLYSMRLCGKPPYLFVRAEKGSFSSYGLSVDIVRHDNASCDRGQFWLFPTTQSLKLGEQTCFQFSCRFVKRRPEKSGSYCSLDSYSLLPGESTQITVHTVTPITSLTVLCEDRHVPMTIKGTTAYGQLKPEKPGEYQITVSVNEKNTRLAMQVLPPLPQILKNRAEFICRKQQCTDTESPLYGAYLIYDKTTDRLICESDFPDHNAARERLAMGVTVALALQRKPNPFCEKSILLYRDFLEREIVNVKTGEVKNGVADSRKRLYNYPWVSTFYFEFFRWNHDLTALKTAADIMIHYYDIGGENMESHVEVHRLLPFLKKEGLVSQYRTLLSGYLKHADSIAERRTRSVSPEVSCANGMMSMMGVILMNAYQLTNDKKYLAPLEDLSDIIGNFYALQPDFHCYGMAVRYWDLYWFGGSKLYGDTFPQWLCANTAEFYFFYDKIFHTRKHSRLIREILLGCCCVYDRQGFGSCGYLYPKEVVAYSSDPSRQVKHRAIGQNEGAFYDNFANDQDWSLYYAFTLLPEKYGETQN